MLANEAASVSGRYIYTPNALHEHLPVMLLPNMSLEDPICEVLSDCTSSSRPWKMVMVDQRNHGASSEVRGFHPPHSIQASAGDLLSLVKTKLSGRIPDMLVGHSLGGKTVLELLRQLQDSGQQLPKQVFVLDSPLGETNGSNGVHSDTEKVIAYLHYAIALCVLTSHADQMVCP